MKKTVWIFSVLSFVVSLLNAQISPYRVPSAAELLSNGTNGREFWIAIPQNEYRRWGSARDIIEIYIASAYETKVTIYAPNAGVGPYTAQLKPMEVAIASTKEATQHFPQLPWSLEVRDEGGKKTDKAIHITADQPIAVYVLSAISTTAEGYMALPTEVWGKKYIHVGYYDFCDGCSPGSNVQWKRGSGFIVLSKFNGTVVQIRLKGTGTGILYAPPNGREEMIQFPRDWGKTYTITLNEGDAYVIQTRGDFQYGLFDISGTEIIANKPVGVISFHVRTQMPLAAPWAPRDHLSTMLPPVHAWGRQYITGELLRENRGDYFRIIAAEDNTQWEVKWYDKQTGELLGQLSGLLRKAGEFFDYLNDWNPPNIRSIRGFSVWKADKPVMVLQYSYSAPWDGANEYDPFYFWVVPVEQYTKGTVFETPARVRYSKNYFNLLAISDPNDESKQGLKSIKIDGQPVWQQDPGFLVRQVPGTDVYYSVLQVTPGPHYIEGDAPFGGYIYGYTVVESYGWPAATAVNKIDELDTLEPVLEFVEDCGDYDFTAWEERNGKPNDNPRQIDQGVSKIELIPEKSFNYRLVLVDPPKLENTGEKISPAKFRLEVIDKSQDAQAYFIVVDRAGNVAYDSVFYEAPKLVPSDTLVFFDTVRVGKSRTLLLAVVNGSDSMLVVEELRLQVGDEFEIVTVTPEMPASLASGDTLWVELRYTPKDERSDPEDWDIDSLFAATPCVDFPLAELRGQGVLPHIVVGDWDAGRVPVGLQRCNSEDIQDFQRTVEIRNPGSTVLTITEIRNVTGPFSVDETAYTLPIKVEPGETIYFKGACFTPPAVQEYQIDVEFVSDAPAGDDNISRWRGEGIEAAPYITSYDWEWRRLQTVHSGQVEVGNGGNNAVTIDTVYLTAATPHFRITGYEFEGTPLSDPQGVTLNPKQKLLVFVEYEPQVETAAGDTLKVGIRAEFIDAEAVEGELRGQSYLPKIGAEGYEFACVELGTESAEQGVVKIWNADAVWPLQIWNVAFDNGVMSDPQAFWAEDWPQFPVTLDVGDTLKLAVRFRARTYPSDSVRVRILSDAGPGPQAEPQVESGVMVRGCAYVVGLEAEGTVIGPVLGCEGGEGAIVVRNTGSAAVDVTDVRIVGGDVGEFEVIGPRQFVVPAGGERQVGMRLLPGEAGQYEVEVLVESGSGDTTVVVRGERYSVPVVFVVEDVEDPVLPGDTVVVPVRYEDMSGEAGLQQVVLEIQYNGKALGLKGVESMVEGWNFTAVELKPGVAQISGQGQQPLPSGQQILAMEFEVYLESDSSEVGIVPVGIEIGEDRAVCVEASGVKGRVPLSEFCLRQVRDIVLGERYGIEVVGEQPVRERLVLQYGIAFDGEVRIGLYDAMGMKVRDIVKGYRKAGLYQVAVRATEISSGVYYVRMSSGRFTKTLKVNVVK